MTDLLVGAIAMPLMISKLSNAHEIEVSNKTMTQEWPYIDWPHRDGVCILWLFFDMVACTASIWNLVIIAFDRFLVRYISIHNDRHPTNKKWSYYPILLPTLHINLGGSGANQVHGPPKTIGSADDFRCMVCGSFPDLASIYPTNY